VHEGWIVNWHLRWFSTASAGKLSNAEPLLHRDLTGKFMGTQLVTVFGGSGFIGRHLVGRLAATGAHVRIAVRNPDAALFLKPMGYVGQITPVQANVRFAASVHAALDGADAVVNLVGILNETRRQRFMTVHRDGATQIAQAAAQAGVKHFVHISAIGASTQSRSQYARTKAMGEEAVTEAFPLASILRPSVVFGPSDDFFNRFAALAQVLPVMPVIGCPFPRIVSGPLGQFGNGGPKFQPVYVGDVASAVVTCLAERRTRGQIYELGGPLQYSFKELMELVLRETGRRRILVPVPYWLATLQAYFLEFLPHPLLTRDQVALLKYDNVVSEGIGTLKTLGIAPTAAEAILPTYLDRFRRGGRFNVA
jgi:uncharacterized protein YbjT (DUF2867 family)